MTKTYTSDSSPQLYMLGAERISVAVGEIDDEPFCVIGPDEAAVRAKVEELFAAAGTRGPMAWDLPGHGDWEYRPLDNTDERCGACYADVQTYCELRSVAALSNRREGESAYTQRLARGMGLEPGMMVMDPPA